MTGVFGALFALGSAWGLFVAGHQVRFALLASYRASIYLTLDLTLDLSLSLSHRPHAPPPPPHGKLKLATRSS